MIEAQRAALFLRGGGAGGEANASSASEVNLRQAFMNSSRRNCDARSVLELAANLARLRRGDNAPDG